MEDHLGMNWDDLQLPRPRHENCRCQGTAVYRETNLLAMAKGGHRYVFLYDNESLDALEGLLGRYAENPELSLTARDAEVLATRARQAVARSQEKSRG